MKTMPTANKKKRKPLQNITNVSPPALINQFVPPPPNTQVPALYAPSLDHGMTFSTGMPQFYHPDPSMLAQTPYPVLGLLPPYTSLHSVPTAKTQTIPSQFDPATVNRSQELSPNRFQETPPNRFLDPSPDKFHEPPPLRFQDTSPNRFQESPSNRFLELPPHTFREPSPEFDMQQPFDVLLSNLQELLSSEHHVKNAGKSMETVQIEPNLVHAYIPTPGEDVWQKYPASMQTGINLNKSIHPSIFPTPGVSYSTNQVVPNVSITPYPTGLSLPAMQYPNNWIKPSTSTTEPSPYPTDHGVPITEPRLLTNQIVPNMSATDLSLKTRKQTGSKTLAREPSSNPNQQIPPHSTVEASQSTDQERVAAREHCLKMRFSRLSRQQATSSQVKELSAFLKSQSAQVEMQRLQQLTEATYPHYRDQVNQQCDKQLHQLMDRVEVSLQVLEEQGRGNEVGRRRIPDRVSRVLEEWYETNALHPYPTGEIYVELADATGLTAQQVRKWFSNKRCRAKLLHRSGARVCVKQ